MLNEQATMAVDAFVTAYERKHYPHDGRTYTSDTETVHVGVGPNIVSIRSTPSSCDRSDWTPGVILLRDGKDYTVESVTTEGCTVYGESSETRKFASDFVIDLAKRHLLLDSFDPRALARRFAEALREMSDTISDIGANAGTRHVRQDLHAAAAAVATDVALLAAEAGVTHDQLLELLFRLRMNEAAR